MIDAERFDSNESSDYSSKECILEDNLQCPGECDLNNDYPLAPEKDLDEGKKYFLIIIKN